MIAAPGSRTCAAGAPGGGRRAGLNREPRAPAPPPSHGWARRERFAPRSDRGCPGPAAGSPHTPYACEVPSVFLPIFLTALRLRRRAAVTSSLIESVNPCGADSPGHLGEAALRTLRKRGASHWRVAPSSRGERRRERLPMSPERPRTYQEATWDSSPDAGSSCLGLSSAGVAQRLIAELAAPAAADLQSAREMRRLPIVWAAVSPIGGAGRWAYET